MNDIYQVEEPEVEESPIVWPKENPLLKLNQAMENISATVNVAIRAIKVLTEAITKYMYEQYPNRRVVHLALHGKRARTRKKNMNRIIRDFKNEIKANGK